MLKFILGLVVIGAVVGLIFSRRGEEGEGMLRGAKIGGKIGCGCLVALLVAFLALIALVVFAMM